MKISKTSKIGTHIRWYRLERLSMSQSEFGERYGVSHVAVSQWERGESIPPTELLELVMEIVYQKGYYEGSLSTTKTALLPTPTSKEK